MNIRKNIDQVIMSITEDIDQEAVTIIRAVDPYTMTGFQRIFALIQAVRYIVRANIPGSIVECGVWRGGSMMAAICTLQLLGRTDIDLYLFDTYEGMTTPSGFDVDFQGQAAFPVYEKAKRGIEGSDWCYASIEEVELNLASTGYDMKRVKLIKGKVEDTIPEFAPDSISILRLDTDWYESTKHELIHLFPRLALGGVLIIDDYGHWQGSRKAVDEYFEEENIALLLNRIDYSGRLAVKR